MNTWSHIENCITMAVVAIVVLGLYYMGAGYGCGLGFVAMLNLNYPRSRS